MNIEYGLILSILKHKNLAHVTSRIESSDFKIPEHKSYFEFIREYYRKYNNVPSPQALEKQFNTIFNISDQIEKDQYYIDQITDRNSREKLITILRDAGKKVINNEEVTHILDILLIGLRALKSSKQDVFASNFGREAIKRFERYLNIKKGVALFYKWGLSKNDTSVFDTEIPLTAGRLYLVQARPGVGKTFLICTIAGNLAKKSIKSLIISKEMSNEEILERVDAFTCGVSYPRLKKGHLTIEEEEKYKKYLTEIEGQENIEVVFPKNCTQETIRQLIETHEPNIVFIDYLQLLKDSNKDNKEKRLQMSNIIYDLKSFSQFYKIPIVVVSATNREGAKEDTTPGLENIAESDSIGFAIDVLISLYQTNEDELKNIMKVSCSKNRHGKRFVHDLMWDIDNSQIYEI